jgi:phage/plasmid-associated DNA primase
VARKFYECEDVATLSNNIEKKFGLQSIYKGFMFISPEIKGDLSLEQAEFQSLVSGEDLSVARKNETALSVQWKTPGILGGNEVPNWKDNSGSILRRLATLNFGRQIAADVADPHLDAKLETEMPAILCKCLRAYLDYAHKYASKDIWNVLPKYFAQVRSQVATVTNSLQHFLCSEKLRFGSDLFVPQREFIARFNQHCKENNLGSFKFNQDFYAGPFSARDLEVRVDSKIYNGNAYSTQPFIFGLDFLAVE